MTFLSLILSTMVAFYTPTIDGQRIELPYEHPDLPYLLGISAPDLTLVKVNQGDWLIYDGYFQGERDIARITSQTSIDFYGNSGYIGSIVPEPTTASFLILGYFLYRKRKDFKK